MAALTPPDGPSTGARQVVVVLPDPAEAERHWRAVRRALLADTFARAHSRGGEPVDVVRDGGDGEWLRAVDEDLRGMRSRLPPLGRVHGEPLAVFRGPPGARDHVAAVRGRREPWGASASTGSPGPSLGLAALRLAILASTRSDERLTADETGAARRQLRSWRRRVARLALSDEPAVPDTALVEDACALVREQDFARAVSRVTDALEQPGPADPERLATVRAIDELLLLGLDSWAEDAALERRAREIAHRFVDACRDDGPVRLQEEEHALARDLLADADPAMLLHVLEQTAGLAAACEARSTTRLPFTYSDEP